MRENISKHLVATLLIAAALCLGGSAPALAISLSEALTLARRGDPSYLGARAQLDAAQERGNYALSNLLPQISASLNTQRYDRLYIARTTPESRFDEVFKSDATQVNLTQALWRSADYAALTQAKAETAQAEQLLVAAEQDLLARLVQAWFEAMYAHDHFVYTEGQVATSAFELAQTAQAVALDLLAKPALEEARLRLKQAIAERVAAANDQELKHSALEQIIGPLPFQGSPRLADHFAPVDLRANQLDTWLARAENNAPTVLAAAFALSAASEEVRKQRAGHEPTVDIVGSYGRTKQGSGTFGGQEGYDNTQGTIGLQVNLPIFSSGGQSAKVREAVALREKTLQDLEAARRTARATGKQAWYGWLSAQARLDAAVQATQFGSAQLEAALAGASREIKTELDVLRARQNLYAALRDHARARYDLVISFFKLKALTGSLSDEDVLNLDQALQPRDKTAAKNHPKPNQRTDLVTAP